MSEDSNGIDRPLRVKGRGAASNPRGRFEHTETTREDDDWHHETDAAVRPATQVIEENARSIVSRNTSPDIPFEQSNNP